MLLCQCHSLQRSNSGPKTSVAGQSLGQNCLPSVYRSYHSSNGTILTTDFRLFDLYRYIVSRPKRYRWDNYTGLPRDLYIASHARDSNLEMRKKCHFFEAFFSKRLSICLEHFFFHWKIILRIAYCFITRENSQER